MFYVNIIKSYRDVVAICDAELLGKKFEDGNFQLDVRESFYRAPDSAPIEATELIEIIHDMSLEDATFNLVGKKAIDLAISNNLILKSSIKEIEGIPFALVLL